MNCPCCGAELANPPSIASLVEIRLGPVQRKMVEALIAAYPRGLTSDELVWKVYGGMDEPDNSWNVMAVLMPKLRAKLAPYGWTVPMKPIGFQDKRYKLETLPQ